MNLGNCRIMTWQYLTSLRYNKYQTDTHSKAENTHFAEQSRQKDRDNDNSHDIYGVNGSVVHVNKGRQYMRVMMST